MTKDRSLQLRRLLVAGAPGTGRRTVGTMLELERGFRHVRVGGAAPAGNLLQTLAETGGDVVVTWTAPLDEETLEWLRLLGFEFVRLAEQDGHRSGWRVVNPFAADGSVRPAGALAAELLDGPWRQCSNRPHRRSASLHPRRLVTASACSSTRSSRRSANGLIK